MLSLTAGTTHLRACGSARRRAPQRTIGYSHDAAWSQTPQRKDLAREVRSQILSFSHGIHFCLGAPLARLEGTIAFETLLHRLLNLEPAVPADALTWKQSFVLHRLQVLPVTFTPVR